MATPAFDMSTPEGQQAYMAFMREMMQRYAPPPLGANPGSPPPPPGAPTGSPPGSVPPPGAPTGDTPLGPPPGTPTGNEPEGVPPPGTPTGDTPLGPPPGSVPPPGSMPPTEALPPGIGNPGALYGGTPTSPPEEGGSTWGNTGLSGTKPSGPGYTGSRTTMTGANGTPDPNNLFGPTGQPYQYDSQGNVLTPGMNGSAADIAAREAGGAGMGPINTGGIRAPSTNQPSTNNNGTNPAEYTSDTAQQIFARAVNDANNAGYGSATPGGGIGGGMGGGLPGSGGGLTQPPSNTGALAADVKSFQDAQDAANKANAAMYGNIQSGYNQLGSNMAQTNAGLGNLYGQRTNDFASGAGNVLGNYGNLLNSQTQGYGNIQNNQAQGLSNIGQGYTSLLGTALNNLNLLGATEGTDLNEQFKREGDQAQQSLVDRGLNNTTVTDAVQRGIGLDKARAMTNLAQGVNRDTNNTLSQFGNPALQFGQQAVAANTGLGTQALQNENQIAQAGLGAQQNFLPQIAGLQGDALQFGNQANQQQTQLGQNQLNFMQGVNQQGPDYNTLAQLMMAAGAAGTGVGTNGYNSLPTLPAPKPIGNLPGANLSSPNYSTPQGGAGSLAPPPGYNPLQALQTAYRPSTTPTRNLY